MELAAVFPPLLGTIAAAAVHPVRLYHGAPADADRITPTAH